MILLHPPQAYSLCVLDPAAKKLHSIISLLWTEPRWVVNLIYSLPQLQMSLPTATDHQGCPAYIIKSRNPFLMTGYLKFFAFVSLSLLSLCQIHTQQDTSSLHHKSHWFMLLFLSCMRGILFPKACCFHFSFSFFFSEYPPSQALRLKWLFGGKKKHTKRVLLEVNPQQPKFGWLWKTPVQLHFSLGFSWK